MEGFGTSGTTGQVKVLLTPCMPSSMYHVDVSVCLSSWEEVAFGVSVCAVAWSTSRPGVFYASYADRTLLVWDLIECTSVSSTSRLTSVTKLHAGCSLYVGTNTIARVNRAEKRIVGRVGVVTVSAGAFVRHN